MAVRAFHTCLLAMSSLDTSPFPIPSPSHLSVHRAGAHIPSSACHTCLSTERVPTYHPLDAGHAGADLSALFLSRIWGSVRAGGLLFPRCWPSFVCWAHSSLCSPIHGCRGASRLSPPAKPPRKPRDPGVQRFLHAARTWVPLVDGGWACTTTPAKLCAPAGGTSIHASRGQPAPSTPAPAGSRQPSGGRTVSHFSFSSVITIMNAHTETMKQI